MSRSPPTPSTPPGRDGSVEQLSSIPDQPQASHRRLAVLLVATGLDHVSGTWDRVAMARDVAQALGLIPTVPAARARQHSEPGR